MIDPICGSVSGARWVRVAVIVGALGLFGCNISMDPNRNSGGDGYRHQAQFQDLNVMFSGSVDYDRGDQTDWRFVLTPQRGFIYVTCHFENMEANAQMNIVDSVGSILATQLAGGAHIKQEAMARVTEGRYYLEVKAIDAGSATPYTCEARFDPVVWEE